jgi:hypothetical protein
VTGAVPWVGPAWFNGVTRTEAAHRWIELGYRPIPWVPNADSKKVATFRGFRYEEYEVTHDDVAGWKEHRSRYAMTTLAAPLDVTWQLGLALSPRDRAFVFDVDSVTEFQRFVSDVGDLTRTWRQTSGRDGGSHHLYRLGNGLDEMPKQGPLGGHYPHLEVKSNGLVAVAPSVHPGGRQYRWDEGDPAGPAVVGFQMAAYLVAREQQRRQPSVSVGGNGSSTGEGRPNVALLLRQGVPDGLGQDDVLRDLVWWHLLDGRSEEETALVWGEVVRRTPPTRETPFSREDFQRHLDGARRKLADHVPARVEPWMVDWLRELTDVREELSVTAAVAAPADTRVETTEEGTVTVTHSEVSPDKGIVVTWAAQIKVRPVHWLWDGRVALGTLALLTGKEGVGKSTLVYQVVADLTNGTLAGACEGVKRRVFVCATEDSWEHVINPRLMAAGADLDLVGRVEVREETDGYTRGLVLPADVSATAAAIRDFGVALLVLDPLISRLDGQLNSHKDADVRRALEPLTKMADLTGCAVLGMIHVNKSGRTDPMDLVMASRAFTAVARSVSYVVRDPDDEQVKVFGTPKNNLGRADLPSLRFRIDDALVLTTEEGEVRAGRLEWLGEDERSIAEMLTQTADAGRGGGGGGGGRETTVDRCAAFLQRQLMVAALSGGSPWMTATELRELAEGEGFSRSTVTRAKNQLALEEERVSGGRGVPPVNWWALEGTDPASIPGRGNEAETA